jgi:hypothetical protein
MNREDLNVVIMAYSRPSHFQQVLRACEANVPKVKVYIDYPATQDIAIAQEKIDDIIKKSSIECEVHKRSERYGLAKSILTTVKAELEITDHIILLEDDCVPTKEFFTFMQDSLVKYYEDPAVTAICGTLTDCKFNPWGWATWSSKWNYKRWAPKEILEIENIPTTLRGFLENNAHSIDKDIWSLSWLAHQHKNDQNSLYPEKSLIHNIGLDHTGVHSHEEGYTGWLHLQMVESLKK